MTAQNNSPNLVRQRAQTVNRQTKENELAYGGVTFSNETIIEELCLLKRKHSDNHSNNIQYLCVLAESMRSVKTQGKKLHVEKLYQHLNFVIVTKHAERKKTHLSQCLLLTIISID